MEADSALFAGLTAILAKCGIRKTDSDAATAIRTGVVLVMAWLIVFVKGKQHTLRSVPKKELVFLILSGLATGGPGIQGAPVQKGSSGPWADCRRNAADAGQAPCLIAKFIPRTIIQSRSGP